MKNTIFVLLALFLASHSLARQQSAFDRPVGLATSKKDYKTSPNVATTSALKNDEGRNYQSMFEVLTGHAFVGRPAFGSTPEITRHIGNAVEQNSPQPSPQPSPAPVPTPVDPSVCMCIPGIAYGVQDKSNASAVKILKERQSIQKE